MNHMYMRIVAGLILLGFGTSAGQTYAYSQATAQVAAVQPKQSQSSTQKPVAPTTKKPSTAIKADGLKKIKDKYGISIVVKDVIHDRNLTKQQIAVVLQVTNLTKKNIHLPKYGLYVRMTQGEEFEMEASETNAKVLLPGATTQWRYLKQFTSEKELTPFRFLWKEIDREVYPKVERIMGEMPVPKQKWENDYTAITSPDAIKGWHESFQLSSATNPANASMLIYTPQSVVRSSGKPEKPSMKGQQKLETVHIVTLRVENRNNVSETIPNFKLMAWSHSDVYQSSRLEEKPVTLQPGERTNVRFAVATGDQTELTSLQIQMPETFVPRNAKDDTQNITYHVGRINIQVPTTAVAKITAVEASMKSPLPLEDAKELFPEGVKLSVEEQTLLSNKEVGFKAMLVRYKLANTSASTVKPKPFHAELETKDGAIFGGVQVEKLPEQLVPNTAVVLTHVFVIPDLEQGYNLSMRIVDKREEGKYPVVVGIFNVKYTLDNTGDKNLHMYPFEVVLDNWKFEIVTGDMGGTSSGVNLKLRTTVVRQIQVMSDPNMHKLQLELVDAHNKLLATKQYSLSGDPKLPNGEHDVAFGNINIFNNNVRTPLMVNFYEVVETPTHGAVKRYLGKVVNN
ncbi:hypothetical protein [Paenibacillus sp. 481]|uniref:hypothetical protein n=1 Tax=Paenibacillus sp. 481 TaxID=2835869 RepID=UPI001E5FCDAF|nr:hypothetical protein [Paenibacillus sp. 481]UHA74825.1 hypothetical protein KIK04_07170 [Paenibacillus sp. 481]